MTVLLPFVVNAALNFVLGLLIAFFLGPAEFGRYAIGAAIIVLVNTALMDWIRLSAVRFYSLKARETEPEIRATLDVLVTGVSVTLCALLVAAIVAGVDTRMPAMMLAAAVLAGIGAGLFDYHGAIARARFLDAAYARLVIVKNVLALLLMVGGAWWTRDPTVVLLGGLLSVAVALMSVRRKLADAPLSFSAARIDLAWTFAKYALPIVAGNAIYSLIPLLNRSLLAGAHGFAEAGYFSLASDMGLRLFGTLGATLEIVLLREVIRLDETRGRIAAQKRMAANLVIVLAVACRPRSDSPWHCRLSTVCWCRRAFRGPSRPLWRRSCPASSRSPFSRQGSIPPSCWRSARWSPRWRPWPGWPPISGSSLPLAARRRASTPGRKCPPSSSCWS